MKVKFNFAIVLIICLCPAAKGFQISDKFKICHQSDVNLDNCLKEAIQISFKVIGPTGIPSLNVPPLEPIQIDEISFGSGTNAVQLDEMFWNVKAHGFSNSTVEKAHYDPEKKMLSFTTIHPTLIQEGDYYLKGKVLVLPVYGNGTSKIILKNSVVTHNVQLTEVTTNGEKFLKILNYEAKMKIGRAHFDFRNLFNGDKQLGDNILKVVNDNWDIIIMELNESINKSYSEVFEKFANAFLSNLTTEEIFPN